MEINSPSLFLEINESEYIFSVGDVNNQAQVKLIYKHVKLIRGIKNHKIIDFDLVFNDIKNNIFLAEQKLNFRFKELILIVNNFNCSFINLTGFKKLNGSQILKENISFILNSLKSNINKFEKKKTILHIFNSKYLLDKKKIENLPIGLFGDFYSHELSFCLINNNDFNNINNIFNKCNIKIKKIMLKSFTEGSYTSNQNKNDNTFFQIKICENNSKVFYFENNSLKFEQKFNFGSNLIAKDISKITSLKLDVVRNIISNTQFTKDTLKDELIEKFLFENENYIKIKKKLVLEIAEARIKEFAEIMMFKNLNFLTYFKECNVVFLTISDQSHLNFFKNTYKFLFSYKNGLKINFIKDIATEDLIYQANKIVHFGWKKEAIPVTFAKKSIIAKFFDILFT
jgi:cell division protein FtsA